MKNYPSIFNYSRTTLASSNRYIILRHERKSTKTCSRTSREFSAQMPYFNFQYKASKALREKHTDVYIYNT